MKLKIIFIILIAAGIVMAPGKPGAYGNRMTSPLTDLDDDGASDLIIGTPYEDLEPEMNDGIAQALYGEVGVGLVYPGNTIWSQDTGFVEDDAEPNDNFAFSLALGDYNCDGYTDMAAGVPYEDVDDVNDAGAVNVLYSDAGGLSYSGDQIWTQNNIGAVAETNDRFGYELASGDIDGDTCDDLVIGVPFETSGSEASVGEVHILYGAGGGLAATDPPDWWQDSAGIAGTANAGDQFGYALATGDFNRDGYDDVAIGAHLDNESGFAASGAVNVLNGSSAGLTSAGNEIWHQGTEHITGNIEDAPEEGDHFGGELTTGDYNGDGYDDLAVGVIGEDVGGDPDAGAVNVIYGSSGGLTASGDQFWTQDAFEGSTEVSEDNDWFGFVLASGDFNRDGRDELAIGVPYEDTVSKSNIGIVQVLQGSPGGLFDNGALMWHQDRTNIADEIEAEDMFGYSLAVGDFNADRYADLAIGVPYEDLASGPVDAGMVIVIHGSAGGLTADSSQDWTQDSFGILDTSEASDRFGYSLGSSFELNYSTYLPVIMR
jgi:hypothetical protein